MIKGIAITGLFLITLFACAQKTAKNPNHKKEYIMNVNTDTATFANGCFWCTEAIFQEVKAIYHVRQEKIEGAQSQYGKDIGSINDKRLLGDCVNRRHRIDGKNNIGNFKENQGNKKWGGIEHMPLLDEESLAFKFGSYSQEPPQ